MFSGKKFTLKVVRVLRRRIWTILVPTALVAAATALSVQVLPIRYRSETRILLIPQQAPKTEAKSIVTGAIEDRLRMLAQRILNRTQLERTIRDFNLYGAKRGSDMAKIVERMREDITVEVVAGNVFRVAYVGDEAATVMRVAERLGSAFIEQNDQEASAEGTHQSFEAQLEDAQRRLAEHEKKLDAYQERFSALRAQLTSNLQAIQKTQAQTQALVESINRDRERRSLVERQLHDAEREIEAIDSPPPDPEVEPQPGAVADSPQIPVSPVRIARERVADLRAELEQLDRQLSSKEAENRRLQLTAESYQQGVDGVRTRESELAELTRQNSTLEATGKALLSKQEASKNAANLDSAAQFELVAPARMVEGPFGSNRTRIIVMGAACGLALGFALVVLLEYRDRTFHADTDVANVLRVPVLGVVPLMQSEVERRRALRRQLSVRCGLGSIVVACLSLVVYVLLH
ncbi:MAG: hypothetical protein C5B57_03625 [Blastocatellia bacterium]|nr:MAG: hypothetical protein C5B57_03625 [Blastocatellia bacterium]